MRNRAVRPLLGVAALLLLAVWAGAEWGGVTAEGADVTPRRLVESFYCKDFSFGSFLKRYPQHQRAVTQILIGDVFERDFDELFADMKDMREDRPGIVPGATEETVEQSV